MNGNSISECLYLSISLNIRARVFLRPVLVRLKIEKMHRWMAGRLNGRTDRQTGRDTHTHRPGP